MRATSIEIERRTKIDRALARISDRLHDIAHEASSLTAQARGNDLVEPKVADALERLSEVASRIDGVVTDAFLANAHRLEAIGGEPS